MAGVDEEAVAAARAAQSPHAAPADAAGVRWWALEVGFNAGHSAAVLLAAFPRAALRSFDLCAHAYTEANAAWLQAHFGSSSGGGSGGGGGGGGGGAPTVHSGQRLHLTCGDSPDILPAAAAAAAHAAAYTAAHIVALTQAFGSGATTAGASVCAGPKKWADEPPLAALVRIEEATRLRWRPLT